LQNNDSKDLSTIIIKSNITIRIVPKLGYHVVGNLSLIGRTKKMRRVEMNGHVRFAKILAYAEMCKRKTLFIRYMNCRSSAAEQDEKSY